MYDLFFFFNDTATTEIYTLSLHDALPISRDAPVRSPAYRHPGNRGLCGDCLRRELGGHRALWAEQAGLRSEEHTSELQSRQYLVCRLLLEKKTYRLISSPPSRNFSADSFS